MSDLLSVTEYREQYTVSSVLAAVLAILVVSPLMIARPCDPAGGCMSARELLTGVFSMAFWFATFSTVLGVFL